MRVDGIGYVRIRLALVLYWLFAICDRNGVSVVSRLYLYKHIHAFMTQKRHDDDDDDNRARPRYEPVREEAGQVPLSGECG